MPTSEKPTDPNEPAQPATDPPARHGWWLAIFALVLSVAGLVVPPKFSWSLDTPLDLIILLAFVAISTWTTHLLYRWWRSHDRPLMIWWAMAVMITNFVLLVSVAQSPSQAFHRLRCTFGTFGFGSGTVWIKVEPAQPPPSEPYHLEVQWGPKQANVREKLYQSTYFTTQKGDFFSREPASITVEPGAIISCGNGAPSSDEFRIELNDDVWR